MEHDGKQRVVQLIVDLNAIDANVQPRVAHRPRVGDPESVQRLTLGAFLLTFGID